MTDYRLIASRYTQALERDEAGRVTKSARHRFGAVFSIEDSVEAARLIRAGAIVPADEETVEIENDSADTIEVEVETGAGGPGVEVDNGTADEVEVETVERPSRNALRSEWEAYARFRGADPELIKEASKADLIELYGDE